ncbi:unnamed protein product, partial [Rotaria sp. Silwood2]
MCSTNQKDWKDPENILDPDYFSINRTAKKTLTLYGQSADNDDDIVKCKNDYDVRT